MKILRYGLLMFLVVVAVGCKQDGDEGTTPSMDKPFVVAIPTYPGFAIPYLAQEKNLFEGIEVRLERIDDAAAINAGMIRGDIDACFTSVDSFVLAASQGVEAQAILMSDESLGADGIVAKPEIKSVATLKRKKVAANLGWPGHFFLLYNLQKAGISFDDVPIINMDADKAGAAFVSGDLDAAVTWEPWLSKATSEQSGKILISTADLPGVILDVMLVRDGSAKNRSGAVQAFVDGYYKALDLYLSDKEEGTRIMAEALGLQPDEFEAMTQGFRFILLEEAKKLLQPTDGAVARLFEEATQIWMKAGVIEQKVATQGRVSNQFVDAVKK